MAGKRRDQVDGAVAEKRDQRVQVTLTPSEVKEVFAAADEMRMSVSEWLRSAIAAKLRNREIVEEIVDGISAPTAVDTPNPVHIEDSPVDDIVYPTGEQPRSVRGALCIDA